MKLLRNRAFAISVMVLLILGSLGLGGHWSAAKLRASAAAVFEVGQGLVDKGVQYDLNRCLAVSHNLLTVASRYPVDEQTTVAITEAQAALERAATPGAKYDAYRQLQDGCEALYRALQPLPLEARDVTYREELHADLLSIDATIRRSGYNTAAAAFNDILGRFPANLLGKGTGVRTLELFE